MLTRTYNKMMDPSDAEIIRSSWHYPEAFGAIFDRHFIPYTGFVRVASTPSVVKTSQARCFGEHSSDVIATTLTTPMLGRAG